MKRLARNWEKLANEFLQPMLHLPRHPLALARFGIPALCPTSSLAKILFKHEPARALFAGSQHIRFCPWNRSLRPHSVWSWEWLDML